MTREEAIKEIEKAFEPAFANYIITALTEGATVSDKESTTKNDIRDNRVENELNRVKDELEPTTKNNLRVDWESYKDVDGNSLDDLILEVLQNNFDCGNTYGYKVADEIIGLLPSVTPQEQDKPMVEIDLYSVIKQKYIEREVLDKIRAEIEQSAFNDVNGSKFISVRRVNRIIDKYKAESEEEDAISN